jgi:hypothetical protein
MLLKNMVPEALEKLRARWVLLVVRYRVLKNNRQHPYIRVHHLQPEDYPPRREFCTLLLSQEMLELNFVSRILFLDESNFDNDHNWHIWAEENPKAIFLRAFQE